MKHVTREFFKLAYFFIKRIMDILFSFIGLLIASPIIVIFSLLIVVETPGSPIFTQKRVGKSQKIFVLYKLRSMCKDCEKIGWTNVDDNRITVIGKVIRRFHIDELPQLYNILIGDMSIVGPRPEIPELTEKFERQYPGFIRRTEVKPGLTGWAQINGGYDIGAEEKGVLDRQYIEYQSMRLDLYIVIKTIVVLFTGHGAR